MVVVAGDGAAATAIPLRCRRRRRFRSFVHHPRSSSFLLPRCRREEGGTAVGTNNNMGRLFDRVSDRLMPLAGWHDDVRLTDDISTVSSDSNGKKILIYNFDVYGGCDRLKGPRLPPRSGRGAAALFSKKTSGSE